MKAHLIDTHLLVPRSRSSAKVKVKYQGHDSQKMGVSGALVFLVSFSKKLKFHHLSLIYLFVVQDARGPALLSSKVFDS